MYSVTVELGDVKVTKNFDPATTIGDVFKYVASHEIGSTAVKKGSIYAASVFGQTVDFQDALHELKCTQVTFVEAADRNSRSARREVAGAANTATCKPRA